MSAPIVTLARAVTSILAVAAGTASAGQLDYALYGGVEHSDNIALSPNNPVSQNLLIPGINFMFTQQGADVQANIAGDLEYHDYLGNKFDNQTQTQLTGQVNWAVVPQRLDLYFEDHAGIQPVDSLASDAPNNQQQTNVLAFGPILHFRLGEALRGQAELSYVNSYASKVKDFNSSRGIGALRAFRDISPTDTLSANFEVQHVDFSQGTSGPNYDRYQLYGRYTSQLAKFNTDVTLGWTDIQFDNAGSNSKPLARVTLGWEPTSRSQFTLAGAYQYTDAAQDISQLSTLPAVQLTNPFGAGTPQGVNVGSVVISSQVYLERTLQVTYTFHTERLSLSVTPIYSKLSYVNDHTFDQSGRSLDVNVDYRLRPTLRLSAFATGERLVYDTISRTDKTYRYGLDLAHQWTPHWSWHAAVSQQLRNSDAAGQNYRENEIFFGVVYRR